MSPGGNRTPSDELRRLALVELDAVHRMAFYLSRNADDAADLVQET